MRVLAGPDSEMVRGVVGHMVKRSSHQDRSSGGGPGIGQEREADKSLRQGNDKCFETRVCIDMELSVQILVLSGGWDVTGKLASDVLQQTGLVIITSPAADQDEPLPFTSRHWNFSSQFFQIVSGR